jgi:homoserine dehydrogenase
VRNAYNAIHVAGDAVGDAMFYGLGAGGEPTASAVVGDLIQAARARKHGGKALGCTCYYAHDVLPMATVKSRYFLRLEVADRPGVLAWVAYHLGEAGVSIHSVLQRTT